MSASHSSTRGRRAFSELTFQVATRIPATVPTRCRDPPRSEPSRAVRHARSAASRTELDDPDRRWRGLGRPGTNWPPDHASAGAATALRRVRLAGTAGSSTVGVGSATTAAVALAARLRGRRRLGGCRPGLGQAARLADRRAGLGEAGSIVGGASTTTAGGASTTAAAAFRDRRFGGGSLHGGDALRRGHHGDDILDHRGSTSWSA